MGRPITKLLRSQSAGDLDPRMLSFERIYAEELAFVWRSLRSLGVPEEALEDAAQDTFLVVHRRLAEPELEELNGAPRPELRAWLFAITRRVAFRYRRTRDRRVRKVKALAQSIEFATVDAAPLPDAALADQDALDILSDFTLGLDEDKRVAFVMYYLEDMSAPAIAAVLEVSVNTVHSRLRLCRDRFERHCHRIRARETRVLASGRAAHVRIEPTPAQRRRTWAIMLPLLDVAVMPQAAATVGVVAQLKWFAATLVVGFSGLGTASVIHHQLDSDASSQKALVLDVRPATKEHTPESGTLGIRDRATGSVRARGRERLVRAATPMPEPRPSLTVASLAAPTHMEPVATKRRERPRGDDSHTSAFEQRSDDLDRETQVMGEIRSLWRAGKVGQTLDAIVAADAEFSAPRSAFERDRRAYEAMALCEEEPSARGRRSHLRGFAERYPDSAMLVQVRARCGDG